MLILFCWKEWAGRVIGVSMRQHVLFALSVVCSEEQALLFHV